MHMARRVAAAWVAWAAWICNIDLRAGSTARSLGLQSNRAGFGPLFFWRACSHARERRCAAVPGWRELRIGSHNYFVNPQ